MSRLDDLVVAASEALDMCGLGDAGQRLLEQCTGDNAPIAVARAWLALGESSEERDYRVAFYALREIDRHLGINTMELVDPGVAVRCPETWDPSVATAGVCP